jgi:peptide/nickel transport system substrate-binding protein
MLLGGPSSPQFLFTEPFLGVGTYDVPELIDPALSGDPEGVVAADAAALADACEQVTSKIGADPDAGTVTMTLAQPWAPFIATIAGSWGSIVDMEWAVENGAWDGDCATWQNFYGVTSENDPLTAIANGTGPYMLDHWTPGQEIVLTANENYWVTEPLWEGGPTGVPAIPRIVIQSVDEWGTRFAMLQAGDADFATVNVENRVQVDPLVGEICDYQDDGSFDCNPSEENPDGPLRMFRGLPSVTRTDAMFTFNINVEGGNNFVGSGALDGNGIPPDFFSDINVRRGFNYCFDWETFIGEVYQGEAEQNVGILIPTILGYNPDGAKYEFDLEQCGAELAQAWGGVLPETGFRFQIAYNTGNTTRQIVAEILQANLQQVSENYVVEVIGLPWPNFLQQQRESRLPIFVSGWAEDIHDPHNWAQPFTVGTYGGRQQVPEEILNQFGDLVNAGVAETDPAAREEIYNQLDQLDYDTALAIRLVTAPGRHYEQRWVQGWYYNPAYPNQYYYALDITGSGE